MPEQAASDPNNEQDARPAEVASAASADRVVVTPGVPLPPERAKQLIDDGGDRDDIPAPPQYQENYDPTTIDPGRARLTAAAARRVASTTGFAPIYQGFLGLITGSIGGGVIGASAATGFNVSPAYWIWVFVFTAVLATYLTLAFRHNNKISPLERYAELWDQAAGDAEAVKRLGGGPDQL